MRRLTSVGQLDNPFIFHVGSDNAASWLNAGLYQPQTTDLLNGQPLYTTASTTVNTSTVPTDSTPVVTEVQTQEATSQQASDAATGTQSAGNLDIVEVTDPSLTPVDAVSQPSENTASSVDQVDTSIVVDAGSETPVVVDTGSGDAAAQPNEGASVSFDQLDNPIILHPGDDIQAAVNAGGENAVFWLEAGVYRLQTIEPLNGQSFYGAAGAILNGSKVLTDFTQIDGHWVAEGQTQEGERRETDESADGAQRAGYPDAVYINDHPLTPVDSIDQLKAGTFYFDYDADRIYFGDDPNGQNVEAAVSTQAIASSASDVTVNGLIVEKYATPTQFAAISGDGENWTISNNEVRLNYGVGINVESNGQILDNFVHDNGQMGLNASGSGVLIEGNEIATNGFWSGIDVFWEGGGAKFTETQGLVVQGNYSHDNNGYGLWTDINNINTTYEGNRLEYNSGGGINHEISYAASIHDNSFVGNGGNGLTWLWGSAIQVQNSQDVEIYNNTIDASSGGNGIGLIQQYRGEGTYGEYITQNNSVHDNVLTLSENSSVGGVADYNEESFLSNGNTFNNNEYHVEVENDQFAFGDFYTFADYQKISLQDANSSLIYG